MTDADQNADTSLEIKRAAQLSITEIGLGSLGHGFKIPLTGQVLSLNQLAFLLNAVNADQLAKSSTFEISGIAAILKSFSPAGKKLGPMLSIAMQGFLFWLGISILGLNILGQIVGAILLCLWAFVQPFLTLFMIYGFDLVKLIEFYIKRISEDYTFVAISLAYAVVSFLILKLLVAIGFVVYSLSTKRKIFLLKESKMSSLVMQQLPQGVQKNAFKAALKDLLKPLFLLSFILMLIFIWQISGSQSQKIWWSLRPLATAFILFYILRSTWISEKLISFSKKSKTFERIYSKAKSAMSIVAASAKKK